MYDLPGVALVTGAGSGIGKETAKLFAKEGCQRITIADINATSLEETKKLIEAEYKGVQVKAFTVDITDEASVQAMVDGTVEAFGRVDYCANVAGIILLGPPTAEMSTAFFDKHYDVNLRGIFFCERAQLQAMLKQEPIKSKDSKHPARGAIANVSSMAGLIGKGEIPAYTATKHGVIGLSKADGLYYGKHGIRVNAVCPGTVITPILVNSGNKITNAAQPFKDPKNMGIDTALGRLGDPEELAEALVWITSHRASYINATTLTANGGQVGA